MTPDEIDDEFVPQTISNVEEVEVGQELVLFEDWRTATALNPTGALIWRSFDGTASLGQVSSDLSASTGAAIEVVGPDVIALARELAARGLLANVDPGAAAQPEIHLEPIPALEVGDPVADPGFVDLAGARQTLAEHLGPQSLIVNWSPHCGYCWAIAEQLAVLTGPLADAGVKLVLVTAVGADANREVAEAAGLTAPILIRGDGPDPFVGYGTPSAYHVDSDGRLVAPMVHGTEQVLGLASELAGVDPVTLLTDDDSESIPAGTRYLLSDDGVCAPTFGDEPPAAWSGTGVYRIDGFHVGVRHDSDATAEVLEALFRGQRVRDRRAGHSYSVTLNHGADQTAEADAKAGAGAGSSAQALNLLVRGGRQLVRSRSAARVLRALLWRLTDDIMGFDTEPERLRVQATAALTGDRAILLPAGLTALGDGIGPRLARIGVGVADMAFPEIDLRTAELVIPEPEVTHDSAVLAELDRPIDSGSELTPARPGRYRLLGWGVIRPGPQPVQWLSPAEAAAATLSHVYEAEDPAQRLQELGDLFTKTGGFGLWYHSEAELVAAIGQAISEAS